MDSDFEQLASAKGVSSELFLWTAVELINGTNFVHPLYDDGRTNQSELAQCALRYLRTRAAKGDVEAKIKLSTVLLNTTALHQDSREAEIWARSVFDRRLSSALANYIEGVEDDLFDTVLKRAEEGSPAMCHLVGLVLLDGVGLPRDVEQGVAYLKKAASAGHNGARVELASILGDAFKYPGVHDIQESLSLYEEAASDQVEENNLRRLTASDARALTDLARLHYEGNEEGGVPRDREKAYRYARRVAEATGEQYCQYIVGDILLHDKKDARQAIFWLTQSGEQGFPLAIETLSRVYYGGLPNARIKRDFEQAHEWCLKGDDIWPSGLGFCQTCLGDMYRSGLGVPKDLMRSFEYYQKAASQQDAPQNYARFMLGEMFFKGEGWPQNSAVASEYYKLAAAEDYQPAKERLDQLAALEGQKKAAKAASEAAARRKPWQFWSIFGGGRRKPAATV
ncbi:hypothetical protein BDB00DRAFT_836520 [Zychaea mexicana]|uniref:uncharacterized protein n=1 Tax=Zychaea mexicana TaxID=64656 RepID=UPI0022FE39A6|nr:uncharacterized protein BDB00DRAFT_836520 [Zychaea mexicana]KAI9490733.1 hypothetical protein BDB00DRAFT_836520 [Zychaea mexicana]